MGRVTKTVFFINLVSTMLTIAILVAILISGVRGESNKAAESKLKWMTKDFADRINTEILLVEERVGILEDYIRSSIDVDKLRNDPNYLDEYEKDMEYYIKYFAEKRSKVGTGWVSFDPKWSDTSHDVFFADVNGDGVMERQPNLPASYYNNTPLPDDDKQWWYGAKETGNIFWTNPYKRDFSNKESRYMVSCTTPIIKDGTFIGVAGTICDLDEIQDLVANISPYNTGYGELYNDELDVVISPYRYVGTRFTSDNMFTMDGGIYKDLAKKITLSSFGFIDEELKGEKYGVGFAKLSNGWVLTTFVPKAETHRPIYGTVIAIMLIVLFCIVLSFVSAMLLNKFVSKPMFEKIIDQAYYDELTGLRNLRKFKEDGEKLLENASKQNYILMKMDLQKFKMYNELFGFAEGDELIKNIGALLESILNEKTDICCRISSDNFAILKAIDGKTDIDYMDGAKSIADRITEVINEDRGGEILTVAGFTKVENGESNMDELFERANLAHSFAKDSKSTTIVEYVDEMREKARREKDLENRMRTAMQNKEFKIYLQFKHDTTTGEPVGAEALVRWITVLGDVIMPTSFVDLFERNGFIKELDFYMFEEACRTIRKWMDMGIRPVPIAVNFARLHTRNTAFAEIVEAVADGYSVPHKYLEIEITETILADEEKNVAEFIDRLHEKGFHVSMDDFGTGYSSLGLLKNINVDTIKIDRSFFVDAEDKEKAKILITNIIKMVKDLGIKMVAEGVEEERDVRMLRKMGCDYIQGYYFSKPMTIIDATEEVVKNM